MKEIATILGVPVIPYTMDEAVAKLTQDTLQRKRNFVVTANAEIIMMAQDDKEYKTLLAETADLILPDGAGTVWAGNYLGYTVPERVAGYDLYLRLLEEAARNKIPVYFFGGKPGIAEEAAAPGLHVAGCRNGYFSAEEEPEIIEDINRSGAAMLFAALGAPKQEKWLAQYRDRLKPSLLMGIGGSFAGRQTGMALPSDETAQPFWKNAGAAKIRFCGARRKKQEKITKYCRQI